MTVIAWDGNTLASDSMLSDFYDGTDWGSVKKVFRLKSGAIIGCAGDGDAQEVMALFDSVACEDELPSKKDLAKTQTSFSGVLVLPDKNTFYIDIDEDDNHWYAHVNKIKGMMACGIGHQMALAAMEVGASAVDAVKVTIKRNAFCKGPIQFMKLDAEDTKKAKKKKKAVEPAPVMTIPVVDQEIKIVVE